MPEAGFDKTDTVEETTQGSSADFEQELEKMLHDPRAIREIMVGYNLSEERAKQVWSRFISRVSEMSRAAEDDPPLSAGRELEKTLNLKRPIREIAVVYGVTEAEAEQVWDRFLDRVAEMNKAAP